MAKGKGGSDKKAELTDEEYLRFLEKRYRTLKPAPPPGAPLDPAPMEEAVVATVQLPPETLEALRQERAEAARTKLVALGVDGSRLFLTQGGRAGEEGSGSAGLLHAQVDPRLSRPRQRRFPRARSKRSRRVTRPAD